MSPLARKLIAGAALLLPGAVAATPGVEPLWRGPADTWDDVALLDVEGDTAWLLNKRHDRRTELLAVDLVHGTTQVTAIDMHGVALAYDVRPGETDADRRALALLLGHGWSPNAEHAQWQRVAQVEGGTIVTAGAPVGVEGDWLWRYEDGVPVERITNADAGYDPVVSPDGTWLMFYGCTQRKTEPGCDYTQWFVPLKGGEPVRMDGYFGAEFSSVWISDTVAMYARVDADTGSCIARARPPATSQEIVACMPGFAAISWSPSREVALFDVKGTLTRVRSADGQPLGAPAHASANARCRLVSDEVALCNRELVDLVRDVSFPIDGLTAAQEIGDIALVHRRTIGRIELVRLHPEQVRAAPRPAAPALGDLRGQVIVDGRTWPIDGRLDHPKTPVRSGHLVAWAGEHMFNGGITPAILTLDLDTGASRLIHGPQWDPVWLPDGALAGLGRNREGQICVQIVRPDAAREQRHCVEADDAALEPIDATRAWFTWAPPARAPGAPSERLAVVW